MLVTVYRYEQNPAMDVGGVVAHTIFRVVVRTEKCTYKCPPTIVWGPKKASPNYDPLGVT